MIYHSHSSFDKLLLIAQYIHIHIESLGGDVKKKLLKDQDLKLQKTFCDTSLIGIYFCKTYFLLENKVLLNVNKRHIPQQNLSSVSSQ